MTEKATRDITLEERFTTADNNGDGGALQPDFAAEVDRRLSDIEQVRLPKMDAAGVDAQVLSLTALDGM